MAAILYLALYLVICSAFQPQHTGQLGTVRGSKSGNYVMHLYMEKGDSVFPLRHIEKGNSHENILLKKRSFSSFRRRKAMGMFKL